MNAKNSRGGTRLISYRKRIALIVLLVLLSILIVRGVSILKNKQLEYESKNAFISDLQEAAESEVMDGEQYDSELTKMAEGATERGVNEISKGEKNLDSEFKKSTGGKTVANAPKKSRKNEAKKKKKQARQNKKKGRK